MNLTPLTIFGFLMVAAGFTFRIPAVANRELRWIETIQPRLSAKRLVLPFFRELWVLGTSGVLIAALILLTMHHLPSGLIVSGSYLFFAIIERSLKKDFKRKRPFRCSSAIEIHQPKIPQDTSFPSGDALRIWLLAMVFPILFALPPYAGYVTAAIALLVTAGRIVLGAHFITDTLTGSGLGLLGAALALFLVRFYLHIPV